MGFKFNSRGSAIGIVLIVIAAAISVGAIYYLTNDDSKKRSDDNEIKLSDNGQTAEKQESEEALTALCGDGKCESSETTKSCGADCKVLEVSPCNHNGVCESNEEGAECIDCVNKLECTLDKECVETCGFGECVSSKWHTNLNCIMGSGDTCRCNNGLCVKKDCVADENKEIVNSNEYSCCAGLQQNWLPSSGNPNYHFSCTKCGNGVCDYGETSDNCAKDCQCVGLNGEPDSGHQCCAGLTNVNNYYQIDSQGSCYEGLSTATAKYFCVNCGNGVCDANEDKCNCPEDCGQPAPLCGNYKCEGGETMSSCAIDCEPKDLKPVIYLYPPKTQKVNVKVVYTGSIIADYPDYNPLTGWDVIAYPDGHLISKDDGKEYSYLFWEGGDYGADYDLSRGFVVKGADTKQFLQNILTKIGLTPKEYNEFIVYWYPRMKDNPYNIIYFAGAEYTSRAKLIIAPQPDSILRVFMVFKPSQTKIDIMPQTFAPFIRKGFTVVEWGGGELK